MDIDKPRSRIIYKCCNWCLKTKPLSKFYKQKGGSLGVRSRCKECYRVSYKESQKEANKKFRSKNPDKIETYRLGREMSVIERTPGWADKHAIRNYYLQCKSISDATGVVYSVDHIIPLRGKYVSGLNVAENMQIIKREKNSKKGNSF